MNDNQKPGGTKPGTRSPAIAAAVIFFGFLMLFFVMPSIMTWLAVFSPWLAAGFGALAVLSFFLIFWLRARYQRRHQP
ncbi:intracellular growth attenuator family protein [Rhizobium sp. FY34]|uniref:intracellular growth attenuator family protein n=1 Tax=Rhizobium sp. FY34 TaxID=2562309 RepID=UPI0010C14D33|nr:intracellular growth attenuator family protein [Rhizobium sp. FY34]